MRSSDCPLCGSTHKTILTKQTFQDSYLELINPEYQSTDRFIVTCNDCDFTYRDPVLDDNDLEVLYARFRDMSFRNETPDTYFDRITSLPPDESENTAKVEWLKVRLPDRLAQPGHILDIGCGGGVFLYTFTQLNPGWVAYGIEPTSSFAQLAARRLGRPVIDGAYQKGLFEQKFDLIVINQVLEHVRSPVDFMTEVAQDLAPGGYVYLEVPDIRDFEFLPPDHDRFLMQHLSIFSDKTLTRTCKKAEYNVLEIDSQTTLRSKRNLVALLQSSAN